MKQEEHLLEKDQEENDELYEHYSFIIDKGQETVRIDKFLLSKIPNTSRNKIQNACKDDNIIVNERPVKSNYKIKPCDRISVMLPYPMREIELIPQDLPIDIVYEDDTLAIVNKPANMVVHPAFGNYTGTLVNALMFHFQNLPERSREEFDRPGLVHRIDKHTTGLLVIAKTEDALSNLMSQFYHKTTQRKYWALVWGRIKEEEGTISNFIGRSPKDRKIIMVFKDDHEGGKWAVTHYKVIQRFDYTTLVECILETGRTHQIRVHMKHIGHPLFHDLEYGGDKALVGPNTSNYRKFIENCFQLIPGQALHAKTLGFVHPKTKEKMLFDSELPDGFSKLLNKLSSFYL